MRDELLVDGEANRRELGEFLRSRRRSLVPSDLGLPRRTRRRRPGLSREEVAYLSGISADWYGRLEGGLDAAPSAATLLSIAKALKLTPVEVEHLFALASVYPPRFYDAAEGTVPHALRRLILDTQTAGMILWDAYMTPLAWNVVADAMFHITPFTTPLERNVIVRMADQYFIDYFRTDYEPVFRRVVGVFRRGFTANPTPFAREVFAIAQSYPQFRQYWEDREIADETTMGPGPHTRHHPVAGSFSFMATDLFPLRRQDMLRILVPADDASAECFAVLRTLGTPSE